METWLLKSEKGGQTCGHLHVAEAEAWRCLDAQTEPSAWAVASARLAVKDERRQRDVVHEILLWAWVGLASVVAVLGATALVVALVRESWLASMASGGCGRRSARRGFWAGRFAGRRFATRMSEEDWVGVARYRDA